MARAPEIRLAGIPVRVEPTFFVILVLLGLPQPPLHVLTWVIVAAASVLLHELGHAVAFRIYGIRPSIVLHGFGGLTSGSGDLTAGQRIVTSLAGPLSALVLFGLPAVLLDQAGVVTGPTAEVVLRQVVWVNIGWSLINLLPILPLDGGQVFLAVCDLATGGRGRRAAEIISVVAAAGLGLWAWSSGFLFGAVFAAAFAALNLGQLSKVRQDELADGLAGAHRALLAHEPAEAQRVLDRVVARRPSGAVRAWAAELTAWTHLWEGDVVGAETAAREVDQSVALSSSFRGARALAEGRTSEGVSVMAWALVNDPAAPPKSLGAVAVAGTGTTRAVVQELVLLGEPGRQAAVVLRDLMAYTGYADPAAEVDLVLASAPPGLN